MNPIEKHNIFELIGKDRRKYHSALITCYSFDFSFFEERLLTVLRTSNIKNVNVFIDGRYLEHLLEYTTGKEFKANKSYTLTPVYPKGAFHPKIMLLLGSKQGLLIVGSGNLTGSGICSNDEIWGAFHLNAGECQHLSLFAEAWEYFTYLKNNCRGFVHQSFEWIKKFSPWVNTLRIKNEKWCQVKDQEKISFIFNKAGNGILNQLVSLIPNEDLKSITVISPFYDVNGKILTDLKSHFKPLAIHAVIHTELGSIPEKINCNGLNIYFYEWESVIKNASRLHAKIFHFKFNNNNQYLLFGSANASVAAFGTVNSSALNEEVSLLLYRNSKVCYLQELGINIPKKSISLSEINTMAAQTTVDDLNLKYRITYVELEGRKMTLYFDKDIDETLTVVVLDTYGDRIEHYDVKTKGCEAALTITDIENCFKITINEEEVRVSNFQLIHRVEQLIRNNPDPKQEKLEAYIEEFLSGQRDDIADLFSHLSYNWADDNEDSIQNGATIASPVKSYELNEQGNFQKLNEKQFNEISQETFLRQTGILSGSNIKIVEFLGTLAGTLSSDSKEDFKESEETRQLREGGGGVGHTIQSEKKLKANGEKEQRSIFNFFWKLHNLYANMLEQFYDSNGVDTPKSVVTIKGLSNILVALNIFQLFYGKKFQTEILNKDGTKTLKDVEYIQEGSISDYNDSVWVLIYVLGKFLVLSLAGHNNYDYELLHNKQKEMRWSVFLKSMFLIANINWNERTYCYRDTLLLNLLTFINPEDPKDPSFNGKVRNQIRAIKNKSQKVNLNYKRNVDYFFSRLVPRYLFWMDNYTNPTKKSSLIKSLSDVLPNSIIYKKSIGFAQFTKLRKTDRFNQLTLISSGYDWDDDEGYYVLKNHPNGDKVVLFS